MSLPNNLQNSYQLILEINKLKLVFRNTLISCDRKESTAEHSWSATMIAMILIDALKQEFGEINELKVLKLTLIHDIVEIYAGDVSAFDANARKEKEKIELAALKKLMEIDPEFGKKLHDLWHDFENKKSLEAKIAKAADAICPLFQRLHTKQSYIPSNLTITVWEDAKRPHFSFSKTFTHLFQQLKADLLKENLMPNIKSDN